MDRLEALEVFVIAAKHRSFTAVSKIKNISASRVTHLIQGLEKELKVSLFNRTTRCVTLTSAGEALLESVGPSLESLSETLGNIKQLSKEEPKGILRISAPVEFGSNFLMRPITKFLKEHPAVRIILKTSNEPKEILQEGSDISVVLNDEMPLSGVRYRIGTFTSGIYANPSILKIASSVSYPEQLNDQPIIIQHGNASSWKLISSEGKEYKVRSKNWFFQTDTTQAALKAAREGFGFALLPIPLGDSEPNFIRVLPEWTGIRREVSAITSSRNTSGAAKSFITYIKSEFAKGN